MNISDWQAGYFDAWSGRPYCAGVNDDYLYGYACGSKDSGNAALAIETREGGDVKQARPARVRAAVRSNRPKPVAQKESGNHG